MKHHKAKQFYKKSKKFYVKYERLLSVLLVLALLAIPLIYATNLRTTPYRLPITEDWASQSVDNSYRQQIANQLRQQFPNLPQQQLNNEVNNQYAEFYATNKAQIESQKQDLTQQYKERLQADNGQTYLLAIDSYFFYTAAQNYFFNGHTGDTTIINENGEEEFLRKKQLAPVGSRGTTNPELHIRVEKLAFDIAGIDETSTDGEKMKAIYFIPVLFSILASIAVFFAVKSFSNSLYGFFAAMVLSTVGTVLSRTIAGFVDTDVYNIFFPSTIILILVLAMYQKQKAWHWGLGILTGLAIVVYGLAWPSWYLFLLVIGSLAFVIAFEIVQYLRTHKKFSAKLLKTPAWILLISFFVSSFIFSLLLTESNIINVTLNGALGSYGAVATISNTNIWPNVLSSVAELNPAGFAQIINTVGGKIIFFISLFGIVLSLLQRDEIINLNPAKYLLIGSAAWFSIFVFNFNNLGLLNSLHSSLIRIGNNNPVLFIALFVLPIIISAIYVLYSKQIIDRQTIFLVGLFTLWIGGTIFMSFNGVRFILLLAPGFVIAFGNGMYQLQLLVERLLPFIEVRKVQTQKIVATVAVIAIFFFLFSPINVQAQAQARGSIPNFDDEWYTSMQLIKDNSSESAIITSWWDFGHYFIAMSDRGSTFDGATQGTPRAHWVGRLLMENDEDVAHDMLRMLSCGGNQAFSYMLERSNDPTNGILVNKIIYETFGLSNQDKRNTIENNDYFSYSEEEVNEIMNLLACENPPENFVIASGDMVGKAGVWAHWGSWDFTKKYVFDNYETKDAATIAQEIDEDPVLMQQYIDELELIDIRARVESIRRLDLLNQWFAPYPNYVPIEGNYFVGCQAQNTTVSCANGVVADLEANTVSAPGQAGITLGKLVVVDGSELTSYDQNNGGQFDVIIRKQGNSYSSMITQTPLGGALFTKLFYLDGAGITKFSEFDDRTSITGNRIRTWKTDWNTNGIVPEEEPTEE